MKNMNDNLNKITLSLSYIYLNANKDKLEMLKACRNKNGVYMWTNKLNNKIHISSSVNLRRRLLEYYNTNKGLREIRRTKSIIYKALLKYGYSNFKVKFLEFCEPSVLIKRKQYYIDLIKP